MLVAVVVPGGWRGERREGAGLAVVLAGRASRVRVGPQRGRSVGGGARRDQWGALLRPQYLVEDPDLSTLVRPLKYSNLGGIELQISDEDSGAAINQEKPTRRNELGPGIVIANDRCIYGGLKGFIVDAHQKRGAVVGAENRSITSHQDR